MKNAGVAGTELSAWMNSWLHLLTEQTWMKDLPATVLGGRSGARMGHIGEKNLDVKMTGLYD